MDKKNICKSSELILDVVNKNSSHSVIQKSVFIHNSYQEYHEIWRFYVVYEFGHSDNLILYGAQDDKYPSDVSYINLYYYKAGAGIDKKIKQKLKKGYEQQFSPFDTNKLLVDRNDSFVWKINYLYNKVFNAPMKGVGRMNEDLIKYINQISVMKYVYCDVGKPLSVDNMTYMNEIYKNVTERLQK